MVHMLYGETQKLYFCIDIHTIQKVIPMCELTVMPTKNLSFVGLLNLSGCNIPVYDLAMQMNLTRISSYTTKTSIIICQLANEMLGLAVDKIIGLTEITKNNHENGKSGSDIIIGKVNIEDQIYLIINLKYLIERDKL